MNAMPFSSITKAFAVKLLSNLAALDISTRSIVLHGLWIRRRFQIVAATTSGVRVDEATPDYENSTLTLPIVNDWAYIVAECSRFGASVAGRARKHKAFDRVKNSAGESCIVHACHHVSLCGAHRGPWPDAVLSATDPAPACVACAVASTSVPAFRARFHPAATKKASLADVSVGVGS